MIRPTRTAEGAAALALALTVVAILVSSPASALAAGSLAIFLIWRGWRFERDIAVVVNTLSVERTAGRTILRQGAAVRVGVRVDCTIPPGMKVSVRDIPPAVAAAEPPLFPPGQTATYTLRVMAPGETSFGGVVVSASDTFFSRDLIVRGFRAPHLRVFPAVMRSADGGGNGAGGGEVEVDRRTTLTGQSVRGFRPYAVGDDPGQIDWKVTARRGTYYVRQLTGLEGGAPLILVDLPARADDRESFARLMAAVSGAVEGAIGSRDGCSILVITGPEIVRFIPRTEEVRDAFSALAGLEPVEPRISLYRAPGPAALAARARSVSRGTACGERAGAVLTAFARESGSPFAAVVREALGRADASELRVYSLFLPGDRSHLVQVVGEAKTRGMRVVVFAPVGMTAGIPGVDAVEVI